MQTRALQTLIRVSTLGSFAKVAEEMNTTISTVSMQIKSIEDQLDIEIFDRSHRPPRLTPVGREVCAKARDVLNAEKDLLELAEHSGELVGHYRIGFVATASVRLLPGFLKRARDLDGKATFDMETALSEVLEARVRSGLLDAAVVTESVQGKSDLEYHLLRREALKFAVPKTYGSMSITKMRTELPFLQFNPGSGIGKLIQQHMSDVEAAQAKRDIVLESVEAIVECVNKGLGFTLLSEPDIQRYASEDCCIIPMEVNKLARNLSLAMSVSRLSEPVKRGLVRLFKDVGSI